MPKVGTCDEHSVYAAGCEGCKERSRLHRRHTYRQKAYGRWQPALCDATPAREHIDRLRDEHNMTLRQISAEANVSRNVVIRIAAGAQNEAVRRTVDAICAVQPRSARTYGTVPAHGSARRLQALTAIGYTAVDLAPLLDANVQDVRRWRRPLRQRIFAWRHRDIAELYQRLCAAPGPSDSAREEAGRRGWVGPLAWDDIDDPAEQPDTGAPEADAEQIVDIVAVWQVLDGHAPITVLRNTAEQTALWRHWTRYRDEYGLDGPGLMDFARRYDVEEKEAQRIRTTAVGRPTRKTKTTTTADRGRPAERSAA